MIHVFKGEETFDIQIMESPYFTCPTLFGIEIILNHSAHSRDV